MLGNVTSRNHENPQMMLKIELLYFQTGVSKRKIPVIPDLMEKHKPHCSSYEAELSNLSGTHLWRDRHHVVKDPRCADVSGGHAAANGCTLFVTGKRGNYGLRQVLRSIGATPNCTVRLRGAGVNRCYTPADKVQIKGSGWGNVNRFYSWGAPHWAATPLKPTVQYISNKNSQKEERAVERYSSDTSFITHAIYKYAHEELNMFISFTL